jgi:thiol-disulfide isomerase/thioredoxin
MRAALFIIAGLACLVPLSAGQAKDASLRLVALDGRSWIKPGDDGRPSVVAFWDSGCPPCLVELQSLPALARANPNVRFIAAGLESRTIQRRTLARLGMAETSRAIELAGATTAQIQRLGNPRGALPFASAHISGGVLCGAVVGTLNQTTLRQRFAQCMGEKKLL